MLPLALTLACRPSAPPVPETLDAALLAVLHAGSATEATARVDALAALVDREVAPHADGVRLGALAAADLDGLGLDPATEPARLLGAAQQRVVVGTPARYATLVPRPDQSFVGGYARWDRTLVDGDEDGWADHAPLSAADDIEKEAPFGIVLPYALAMDAAWRDDTTLFRSHIPRAGWSDDGGSAVIASLTVELWRPVDGDRTAWFNATWTQVVTPLGEAASDDFLIGQILDGAADVIDGSEAWLQAR
jgi:hypothetical protein